MATQRPAPGNVSAIHVDGLAGLLRAFGQADKLLREDLRDALQEAAAPVRSEARRLAGAEISHMGGEARPWAQMRTGVYQSVVYIAPVERGVKTRGGERRRRGSKFAELMLSKAMEPALEARGSQVEHRLEGLIDEVIDVWERTPGDG